MLQEPSVQKEFFLPVEDLQALASSEVVFGILFILFFVWFLRRNAVEKAEQRQAEIVRDQYVQGLHKEREDTLKTMMAETRLDTLARELELSTNMRKMVDQQERIGDTLKEVSGGLTELEKKVDNNALEVWKVLAQGGLPK